MVQSPNQAQLVVIDGALALIAVLLIVQMWLLSATLDAVLGGHRGVALPATLVSIVLCGACLALGAFVRTTERR